MAQWGTKATIPEFLKKAPKPYCPVLANFDDRIWSRVAFYLPRMKEQPPWEAWTEYRTLNKIFKREIEQFYVQHYLQRMWIQVDGGWGYDKDVGKLSLVGNYDLKHLDGTEHQLAVFRDDECAEQFKEIYRTVMTQVMDFEDPGYNPKVMIGVRRELTDLLPLDLQCDFISEPPTMKFNWRTYFCTFFDEQKQIAAADLDPSKAYVGFVREIEEKMDQGEVDLKDMMETVMKKVLRSQKARQENSFILVRRKRRQRIGLKLLKGLQHRTDERNDRYYQRDENRVAKRMRDRQFFSNFEEFSDSEGYVSGEDSEDSGEFGDEMETSPRPVGAARKHRRQQSSLGGELHLEKRTKNE
jgi:hypothetical protein